MAAVYQFHCCGRSNVVIFDQICLKLPSNSESSWNMVFVRRKITKMAATYWIAFVDTTLVHLIASKFHT